MDNTLNRPLFRRREARDRLNDMAGVRGYQAGGPVFESGGREPVRPAGLPSMLDRLRASGATAFPMLMPMAAAVQAPETLEQRLPEVMRGLDEGLSNPDLSPNERRALQEQRSVLSMALEGGRGVAEAVTDAAALLTRLQGKILRGASPVISAVSPELGSKYLEYTDVFDRVGDTLATAVPEELPPALRPGQPRAERPLEAAIGAANRPTIPPGVGGARPEGPAAGLPAAVIGGARPEGEAAGMPAAPGTAAKGPSFEGTGRGAGPLVTSPAEVAAGLNAPDPAVREKTAADFMQEFMANAPKYEGGDKRLMHAMIGFAIAAGDSPNAMTNIARGLQSGAEMFLKDKAAKDEFDRQLQLSAMQYGLQEVSKERELGRQFTNYVASREVTYRGKTYGPNESVPVFHSDIVNGRMPEGVITEGTSDALMATDAAVRKSLIEAQQAQRLTPAAYNEAIKTIDQAASDYSSASNLMPLLEASLIRTAQGEVNGIQPALMTRLNQVMNAFNLRPPDAYESRDAYDSAMKQASVSLVQDLLGESGKTISDNDRKLIDGLIGLYSSEYSKITTDPDIMIRKIQELMQVVEGKKRTALDTYKTYMSGYSGTYSPSGTPVRSYRAERVFSPEAEQAIPEYVWDQASGRLIIKRGEGQ